MSILGFLYVFALFYVFIPGALFNLPFKGSKLAHSLVHALLFSIILFFTYHTVSPIYENASQCVPLEEIYDGM